MADRLSPRFVLLDEALRTKKIGIYGEIDYPAGFEGMVELLPLSTGSDETCIKVTSGGGSELQSTGLSWKTSTGIDVASHVLRVIALADPSARNSALNDLRDRINRSGS